uniref:N(4)-(beta-N-acetylglucosaminyl)-L-asparaginase n=1 Tax=Plectus sambesii TaxID=2011161 RepID=A0A914UIU4_9BILA
MGFTEESLQTDESKKMYDLWKAGHCQQNFRKDVLPNPRTSCGPYHPKRSAAEFDSQAQKATESANNEITSNHDTIGMVIIDANADVSVGTSTNGATHKIPGRVGDAPLPGAGAYVDNAVGGAAATGDGDVMMRFLPSYHAVELMANGATPSEATRSAIERIKPFYPAFTGAVIAADKKGRYGAACHGIPTFSYCVFNNHSDAVQVITVDCI